MNKLNPSVFKKSNPLAYKKEIPTPILCPTNSTEELSNLFSASNTIERLKKSEITTSSTQRTRYPLARACLLGEDLEFKSILKDHEIYKSAELRSGPLNRTPLHFACLGGSFEIYQKLIEKGADIFLMDSDNNSCFHFACLSCQSIEIIQDLIEKKLNVNLQNKHGNTPLHFACQSGNYNVFKTLLDGGGLLNLKNKDGKLPLQYIPYSKEMDFEKYLLIDEKYSPCYKKFGLSFNHEGTIKKGWRRASR